MPYRNEAEVQLAGPIAALPADRALCDDFSSGWNEVSGFGDIDHEEMSDALRAKGLSHGTGVAKFTGDAHGSNTFLFFWKAVAASALAKDFRLTYLVDTRGAAEVAGSMFGLVLYASQDSPMDNSPGTYGIVNYMPITTGLHQVEFNSGLLAHQFGGAFDAANPVTGFLLRVYRTAGLSEVQPVVYFDALETWDAVTGADFSLMIDDGHINQVPALEYALYTGLRPQLAVATDQIGTTNYMTWDDISRLQRAGVEMACHYRYFPYDGTQAAKIAYLKRVKYEHSRERQLADGSWFRMAAAGSNIFVIPSGTDGLSGTYPSPGDMELMREHFTVVRGTAPYWDWFGTDGGEDTVLGRGSVTGTYYQPKRYRTPGWVSSLNISSGMESTIGGILDTANAHGSLVAGHCHLVDFGGGMDITLANFKTLCDAVATKVAAGVATVVTFADRLS